MRRFVFLLSLLAVVPTAHAVTVGSMPHSGGLIVSRPGDVAPLTLVDLVHPAPEAGSLTTATVRWASAPAGGCAEAFKIKILRQSGSQYFVVAERGPFDANTGINVVTLSPAISVAVGDHIGLTQLKPVGTCGGASYGLPVGPGATRTSIFADPAPSTLASANTASGGFVGGFRASSTPEVLEGYIVVVGSVQGAFGSNFKTSVQLTNLELSTINGRFLFHPAGAPASASDPSLSFTIAPFQTISYSDLVGAMGRTGLGSIDVYTTSSYPPDINVRVFNDAGAEGTSGVTEEMRIPELALSFLDNGILQTPLDVTNLRLNVGVRSLNAGATLQINVFDSNGSQVGSAITRSYPPNFFEQNTAAEFTGRTVPANGVITVFVTAGSAIVYGAVTDNRTNDPNMRWFTRF